MHELNVLQSNHLFLYKVLTNIFEHMNEQEVSLLVLGDEIKEKVKEYFHLLQYQKTSIKEHNQIILSLETFPHFILHVLILFLQLIQRLINEYHREDRIILILNMEIYVLRDLLCLVNQLEDWLWFYKNKFLLKLIYLQ